MHYLNTVVLNETTREIYPQVANMGMHDPKRDELIGAIPSFAKASLVPPLTFNLDPKTLLTDLVSQAYVIAPGMLLSPKLAGCLSACSIQQHELYPATVNHRGVTSSYEWLHFTDDIADSVDFERSRFVRYDMFHKKLGEAEFSTKAEFEAAARDSALMLMGSVVPAQLHFHTPVPDLFALQSTGIMIYVSDSLADSLAKSEATGFELKASELNCIDAA